MKAISSWLLRLIGCLVLLLFGAMGSMPLVAVEQRECGYDAQEEAWKIGGKIHFEEEDGIHYLGLITINKKTIDFLKAIFPISKEKEKCESNAKVLIEKDSQGQCVIRHYEEKRNPGVGEEMHATLLYTSKRIQNGHETLKDIFDILLSLKEEDSYGVQLKTN